MSRELIVKAFGLRLTLWLTLAVRTLAGSFRRPVGFHFGRQFRAGCRTLRILTCPAGRTLVRLTPSKVRPARFLSRGNLPRRSSAHRATFPLRRLRVTRSANDSAQLRVQSIDLLFDRCRALKLIRTEIE